jgi:hypothetical protein
MSEVAFAPPSALLQTQMLAEALAYVAGEHVVHIKSARCSCGDYLGNASPQRVTQHVTARQAEFLQERGLGLI